MVIVQIAPSIIPIPGSGGIERVVYNLTNALVDKGHEVYVYALAGSRSRGVVIPYGHRYKEWNVVDYVLQTMPDHAQLIHDHTHDLLIGQRRLPIPTVSTIHTEWGPAGLVQTPVFVSETKLNQSSHRGRGRFIHNGIDMNDYPYCGDKRDYLLFLGRIDWGKGVESAIEVAVRTGIRTIIAGPVWNRELYEQILPRIQASPNIEFVGEVHGEKKRDLLMHARWLLFPTSLVEQFGLVLVEALACGTPVAAFRRGAVPEVLAGFPEFVCDNVAQMIRLVSGKPPVHPYQLRRYVEKRFTKELMAERYLELYREVTRS